jgi:hypothetical protein
MFVGDSPFARHPCYNNAMKKRETWMTRRLGLILLVGCLGVVAVMVFGDYVDSISDTPLGPTPLSWGFKSSGAHVADIFAEKNSMQAQTAAKPRTIPKIDQVIPKDTELALFALG